MTYGILDINCLYFDLSYDISIATMLKTLVNKTALPLHIAVILHGITACVIRQMFCDTCQVDILRHFLGWGGVGGFLGIIVIRF